MNIKLLITTNGFKGTLPAIEYGAWFASIMGMKITLLGVTESLNPAAIDAHHPLEDVFERAVSLFKERDVEYSLEVQNGEAELVIPKKRTAVTISLWSARLGRPHIKRWLTGRSIRPLMERITSPILYVPELRLPLKKLLIGVGGLGYAKSAENLAFQVAVAISCGCDNPARNPAHRSGLSQHARSALTFETILPIQTHCPDAV